MKLKTVMQSIEQPASVQNSPRPQYVQEASPRPYIPQITNSPKRPFPVEDVEGDLNRPRKLARGESPLKGAAGRRLDQQKRLQAATPTWQGNGAPFVIPRDITFLLSIIPRAEFYNAARFKADALVRLLAQTTVPDYTVWKARQGQGAGQSQSQPAARATFDGMNCPVFSFETCVRDILMLTVVIRIRLQSMIALGITAPLLSMHLWALGSSNRRRDERLLHFGLVCFWREDVHRTFSSGLIAWRSGGAGDFWRGIKEKRS